MHAVQSFSGTASGNLSHAEGYHTTASGNDSHVVGMRYISRQDVQPLITDVLLKEKPLVMKHPSE